MSPLEAVPLDTSDFITRPIGLPRGFAPASVESWMSLPGRDRVALFEDALDSVWLALRPILSCSRPDGAAFAFEARARCRASVVATPRQLLGLAVSVGRVSDLSRVVGAHAAELLRRHPDLTLFVNVDAEELTGPPGDGDDSLLRFAHRVILQMTERSPLAAGFPEFRERSGNLRERGYRFAVDDLGGGYANLCSLVMRNPHFVRIDESLIRAVHLDPVKRKIVGALIALTRELGITCIAGGVETEGERDALIALGCDLMQGDLFGRSGPLDRGLESTRPNGS